MTHIIKGCPRDKWDEVQTIQHEPFIYIHFNGSHWAGEEEDDIPALIEVLKTYKLMEYFVDGFGSKNPCSGVQNPDWRHGANVPQFIDGPRMYAADGVRRFSGNFEEISHAFCIDTNDEPTIKAILEALQVKQRLGVNT